MKNIINLSELLKSDISPFIFGTILSRMVFVNNDELIIVYTDFRYSTTTKVDNSKFHLNKNVLHDKYISKLNKISYPVNWKHKNILVKEGMVYTKGIAQFSIRNDLNLPKYKIYEKFYVKLFKDCSWVLYDSFNKSKKAFISGFIETRGSIDSSHFYISQDYYYEGNNEVFKARILTDFMNVPDNAMNLNFRELQNEFVKGVNKRNTQLRINLKWYLENIGLINDYKAFLIREVYSDHREEQFDGFYFTFSFPDRNIKQIKFGAFQDRLTFYKNQIHKRDIDEKTLNYLRHELGWDDKEKPTFSRKRDIIEIVRLFTPDECAGCKNDNSLQTRTFTHKKLNRPYLEVHHVISLSNDNQLDIEDNLVKLCPVCHKCLKKNVGNDSEQKHIIEQILTNHSNVDEFTKEFLEIDCKDEQIKKIHDMLK